MESGSTAERILAALEADAKASVGDIAAAADVSKPTARKYIAQLESEGVIVGYSADLDPKKLMTTTIALVGVDVESDQYVAVSRALRSVPQVQSLYSSSGDHMLMAEVRAADGDAVGDVISETILSIDGVTAAHPSFLRERLK
jgi:Lrp/AsnC family transcriptional regulator for asnA, asnC and gidA